jgi:hypothetical protein
LRTYPKRMVYQMGSVLQPKPDGTTSSCSVVCTGITLLGPVSRSATSSQLLTCVSCFTVTCATLALTGISITYLLITVTGTKV